MSLVDAIVLTVGTGLLAAWLLSRLVRNVHAWYGGDDVDEEADRA